MSIGIDVVNVGVSNSSCFFILSICNKQKKDWKFKLSHETKVECKSNQSLTLEFLSINHPFPCINNKAKFKAELCSIGILWIMRKAFKIWRCQRKKNFHYERDSMKRHKSNFKLNAFVIRTSIPSVVPWDLP